MVDSAELAEEGCKRNRFYNYFFGFVFFHDINREEATYLVS